MGESLKGKVAIVTGATSGIGEATLESLVQEGALVAAVGRRKERLNQITAKYKDQVFTIQADISKEEGVQKAVTQIINKWKKIDILIANAGVMHLSPILESKTEEWRKMVEVNVLGVMYCCHQVLPHMVKQQGGHVVTISSVAGRVVFPLAAAYCGTKFAVRAFSEGIRQEVAKDNIRVTVIEPGAVRTELADHISHSGAKGFINDLFQSMETLESKDIASAIIFALQQPLHVNVNEILIRPTAQTL